MLVLYSTGHCLTFSSFRTFTEIFFFFLFFLIITYLLSVSPVDFKLLQETCDLLVALFLALTRAYTKSNL